MSLLIPSRRLLLAPKRDPFPRWIGRPVFQFDPDTIQLLDGDPMSLWMDIGGPGNHLTQVPGARPVLKRGILNGHSVVRFGGTDDWMSTANLLPAAQAQPTTIIIVAKVTTNAAAQVIYDGVTTRQYLFKDALDTGGAYYGAPTQVTGENPHTWGSFEIYTCVFNGLSSALWINGVAKGTGDAGTASLTRVILGDNGTPGTAKLNGDVTYFVGYPKGLNVAERRALDLYFGRRFLITV